MAYGIEIKNKANQTLFSSQEPQHVGLKKVMAGIAEVAYFTSDDAMGDWTDKHKIYLNGGATIDNALIFARPEMSADLVNYIDNFSKENIHPSFSDTVTGDIYSDRKQRHFNRAVQGFWPMAVEFGTSGGDHFYIHGPDNSQTYYDGVRQSTNAPSLDAVKKFNTSREHWGKIYEVMRVGRFDELSRVFNQPIAQVYYEVYIPIDNSAGQNISGGFTDDDSTESGLSIKDTTNKEIYNSNQEFFNIEQTGYNRVTFNDLGVISTNWFGQDGYRERERIGPPFIDPDDIVPVRMYLKNKSNGAQLDYMACLNGTASHQAIIVGGREDSAIHKYEINRAAVTYFKSFVEFHYFDENNAFGNRPYIAQVTRLVENINYNSISTGMYYYQDYIRFNDQLGVPTLSIIGKSG